LEYKDSGALVACQFLQTDLLILTNPIMDFSKLQWRTIPEYGAILIIVDLLCRSMGTDLIFHKLITWYRWWKTSR
jgi:hypothetical protein